MMAYKYSVVLLLAVATTTVTSQTTGNDEFCASEILRVSNAGKITATTSDPLAIGESMSITCSTDCAYYWHTVLVDGEVISSSNFDIQTTEDYQLSVTNTILNCPDCTQPEDVNCSGDSQQEGPIQSILNFTLLSPGDHYVQCIAHMYHPDSDLWPDNRIISIPSRTIKIKGHQPPIYHTSSTSSAVSSLSTASIIPTSSVSITLEEASPTLITNSRQSSSHGGSTSSKPSQLPLVTDTSSSLSSLLSTPSATVLINTRIHNSVSTTQSTSTVSLTTDGHRLIDATTLPSPIQTFIAQADPMNRASSSCNPLNMDNTTIYVVFGVLVLMCVLLIVAVIALIVANRKGVAQYNQLSLSIQGSSTNGCQPNSSSSNDVKEPPTSSSPDSTLSPDIQSSPV